MSRLLMEARNLTKEFPAGKNQRVHAVTDVSLQLFEGQTLGLVGESGCGKSTLGRLMIRMLTPTSGEISLLGANLTKMPDELFREIRPRLQMVFQDPYASLDPRMRVRELIAEPLDTWHMCASREETTARVLELMQAVGIPPEYLLRYPHEFSGGQRQRIGIARALAAEPKLIVCDEPVSALDVSVQNQILNLLKELQKERNLTYLFISHDLNVVRYISDRICVMFLGMICETGPAEEVYHAPLHPYTRFLINSIPQPDPHKKQEEQSLLSGEMPGPVQPPSGCRFRTRCPYATELCAKQVPVPQKNGTREVACHYPLKD